MECVDSNGGSRLVVTELSLIKELVKQLDVNLGGSPELCKRLAAQIFSVTERSIGMIKSGHFGKRSAGLDSPTPSPLKGVSDMTFKPNKKRKTMERRKQQVRVIPSGEGADTPVGDDGHSWRKYGQKEILGAKHPRGYYRCTHRKTLGCAATKQVQRSDEDPTLFDVIYHGDHTCLLHKTAGANKAQPEEPQNPEEALRLLQSLTVETEGLAAMAGPQSWSTTTTTPFSFSSPAPPPPQERYSKFSAPFRAQSEMDKMVSALALVASAEPAAAFSIDEFDGFGLDDFDVSSFFA